MFSAFNVRRKKGKETNTVGGFRFRGTNLMNLSEFTAIVAQSIFVRAKETSCKIPKGREGK